MKRYRGLILTVSLLLSIGVLSIANASESIVKKAKAPEVGEKAPLFKGQTIDEKLVNLEKLQGKLVLIDFWATWCPPCRGEIPHLQKAHEKYHKDGLEIISISNEKSETLKAFIKKNPMPWQHVRDSNNIIGKAYAVRAIPSPFLVDHTGKIVAKGVQLRGHKLEQEIEKHIKNLPKPKEEAEA